jgi:nitroreductase
MELRLAVRQRRMSRNFTGRPPDPGVVDAILADALRAPSAGNTQGRDLVVLEGPSETKQFWETTTDAAWRARSGRFAGLSRAPVVVLVFAAPGAYRSRYEEPDKRPTSGVPVEWVVPFWFVDAAFATMTILLRATEEGLGAAFLGNFRGEEVLRVQLGVPGDRRWLGAVLLGEATGPDPPSSSLARGRRPFADSVHRGAW